MSQPSKTIGILAVTQIVSWGTLYYAFTILAAGMQRELSEFPPIFLRVWRSQTAHEQPIVRPKVSESLDWEGELAVIIGKGGRDIPEADAMKHVAGYACYAIRSSRKPD